VKYHGIMKRGPKQLFYSKILLFGEYSLMVGSMALSIPFKRFSGKLVQKPDRQVLESGKKSNFHLDKFARYLEDMFIEPSGRFTIDVERFKKDIAGGLVFQSNIPQGYGLGSSGALAAAVYAAYGSPFFNETTGSGHIIELKDFLAQMESCFHGKSSGLDPLICYLKKPVLIESKDKVEIAELPQRKDEKPGAVFLIDSGSACETQPLVDLFIDRCRDENFLEMLNVDYIPLVNACIRAYCDDRVELLNRNLQLLSDFQLKIFNSMIPSSIRPLWEKGIETGKYSLKLCGSGGGGMVLGFTPDFEPAKEEMKDEKITLVHYL